MPLRIIVDFYAVSEPPGLWPRFLVTRCKRLMASRTRKTVTVYEVGRNPHLDDPPDHHMVVDELDQILTRAWPAMRLPGGTRLRPGLSSPDGTHGSTRAGSGTPVAGQLARITCPRPIVRCSLQVFGGTHPFGGGSTELTAQLNLGLQGRAKSEYRGP